MTNNPHPIELAAVAALATLWALLELSKALFALVVLLTGYKPLPDASRPQSEPEPIRGASVALQPAQPAPQPMAETQETQAEPKAKPRARTRRASTKATPATCAA